MTGVRQALKIGLMLLVVAGLVMSGLALAQSGSDAEPEPLHPADQRAIERLVDLLAPLVTDGTITQQQALAVAEHIAATTDRPQRRSASRAFNELVGLTAEILGLSPADLVLAVADGATLSEIAERQGSSAEALATALLQVTTDRVKHAVDNGNLGPERAAEILHNAEARIRQFVKSDHAIGDQVVRRARHAKHKTDRRGDQRGAILELLGMTADELKSAIAGKSLAAVAAERGVSAEALVDALIAPVEAELDDAVTAKRLTRVEADERLAKVRANAEELIQRVHHAVDGHP